jgi:hypothetical protein
MLHAGAEKIKQKSRPGEFPGRGRRRRRRKETPLKIHGPNPQHRRQAQEEEEEAERQAPQKAYRGADAGLPVPGSPAESAVVLRGEERADLLYDGGG